MIERGDSFSQDYQEMKFKGDDSGDMDSLMGHMQGGSKNHHQGLHKISVNEKGQIISPIQDARGSFRPPRDDIPPQELFTQGFSGPKVTGPEKNKNIFEDNNKNDLFNQLQPQFLKQNQPAYAQPVKAENTSIKAPPHAIQLGGQPQPTAPFFGRIW